MTQDTMTLAIEAMVDGDADRALKLTSTDEANMSAGLLYVRCAAYWAKGDAAAARATRDSAAMLHILPMMAQEGIDVSRMARDGAYAMSVARKYYNAKIFAPAILAFKCAMNDPAYLVDALFIAAQAEHFQGRNEEALDSYNKVLIARPNPSIHSFILYTLFFVEDNVRAQAEEAQRYYARWAPPYAGFRTELNNSRRTDRKLRIGYMAPTYSANHSSFFIQNMLERHDKDRFDVFIYVLDAEKERTIPGVTVRSMGNLSYPGAAALIRSDEIDVMIDFHGHAAYGRPIVYTMRVAPVQVSWLAWIMTTGIQEMDYVIHCDHMDAPEPSLPMPERVVNVGPVMTAYRPHDTARSWPCPALERGYVTFASFNHPGKLSDLIIGKWAQILKRVPNAKLHLKYMGFDDVALQMETMARFLAHGVRPEALEFSGFVKGDAYEEAFSQIDIGLDTSPYPGGTTTLDAVARGVPVLTLNGPNFYTQLAVSAMMALKMPELVAQNWDEYIEKAVAYANNIPRLAALRERVKPAFDASPYRDEEGFARRMEDTYVKLFADWAQAQAQAQAEAEAA